MGPNIDDTFAFSRNLIVPGCTELIEDTMKCPKYHQRTFQQIREHYELEKQLAEKLRRASKEERRKLYSEVYDHLYQCLSHHPQLITKRDPEERQRHVQSQMMLLRKFLFSDSTFLEIGPGDCSLGFEVAKFVNEVYAIDISEEITKNLCKPRNVKLIISDGCEIPLPSNSVNVAYSNQVMEHLHPDDALEQLRNIYNVLNAGGVYICVTPNRLNGPHDISKYFDEIATGFHLKEYTIGELERMFKEVGFSKISKFLWTKRSYIELPILPFKLIERLISEFKGSLAKKIASWSPMHVLLYVKIIGVK